MAIINFVQKGPGFLILLFILAALFLIILLTVRRSDKKQYTVQIMIPVFFMELALLFGILVLGFPETDAKVGPGVVPSIWIISILALSLFLLIRVLTGKEDEDPGWGRVSSAGVIIAFVIIYLVLMQFIGYTISTILFLVLSLLYLKYRNWKTIIILTAAWILFSYFAFYRLLFVPLPKGLLIERIF